MNHGKQLPDQVDTVAPDGSAVRVLLDVARGSMIHVELAAGETSVAVWHRTVDELWYFVAGTGRMWLRDRDRSEMIDICAGMSVRIPCRTHFQFSSAGPGPLAAIAVTMPPWPGDGEAVRSDAPWREPTVAPGPGLAAE